ncbi:MAG: MAE_28990/MAE_18760 family HEPN-like nuclease [Cyanobacteriota bacterium]|nr:MAE_28990/MAE_18760 family HEPN-like nuclease [Cyanobacteriota bacterium]
MKSTLFKDFDERSQEVRSYFLFIKNLEYGSIQLNVVNAKSSNPKKINNNLAKTLKATGFLLLYNLVESTMTNAIETIFDELKNQNVSFDDVREELKKIIIENFKKNNSTEKLLVDIQSISVDIISSGFDKQKLFSGNIDAKKIREIASKYGFSFQTNARKTQNGADLLKIKTSRNDLAHGLKSFEDVGKDLTADELLRIQKRVICYLKAILENIDDYISKKEYLK